MQDGYLILFANRRAILRASTSKAKLPDLFFFFFTTANARDLLDTRPQ